MNADQSRHEFTATIFPDAAAASLKKYCWTFDILAERIRSAKEYPTKADCPWIKLATFGDQRTEKNSLRHDANVLEISGVEGDYDSGVVSLADAQLLLAEHRIAAILYTSPSHTEAKPRWRVLCPLSKPYPPSERGRFVARVNGALGGILAPESFTLSQSYYVGRVIGAEYRVSELRGEFIDLLNELDAKAINRQKNGESRAERLGKLQSDDPVIAKLNKRKLLLRIRRDGGADLICPFEAEHTTARTPGDCCYWPAHTGGFKNGHFRCMHSHCLERPDGDFLRAIGIENEREQAWAHSGTTRGPGHRPGDENAQVVDTVQLIDGASIAPEAVKWLWDGFLARGKLHVLAGVPGTGKTMIALALAATVSTGGRWPDGTQCNPGNVVIWSAEDDRADTLVPRLIAMGADMHKIRFVGDKSTMQGREAFDPARDMPLLMRGVAGADDIDMLIVDPIVSAVAGDSHKNAEVRRGLQPLVDVGQKLGAAVLGISHFSKGTAGREVTERVTGSLAFGALARVVLAAAKRSDEDGGGRILARAKSNIGPDGGGFAYDLAPGSLDAYPDIKVHVLQWGKAIEGSARDLLASAEDTGDPGERNATDEAANWLGTLLTEEGGQVDRRDVMRAAQAMGFKERTVHRARQMLGLIVVQTGFGRDKRSVWKRGDSSMRAKSDHACQQNSLANMNNLGTYGGSEGSDGVVEVDV